MPKLLKVGMKVIVPGEVLGYTTVGGRQVMTVAVANTGQRVTFDASWLPDADAGDEVHLPGKLTRVALPDATVKLDYFATPITLYADQVTPA